MISINKLQVGERRILYYSMDLRRDQAGELQKLQLTLARPTGQRRLLVGHRANRTIENYLLAITQLAVCH